MDKKISYFSMYPKLKSKNNIYSTAFTHGLHICSFVFGITGYGFGKALGFVVVYTIIDYGIYFYKTRNK